MLRKMMIITMNIGRRNWEGIGNEKKIVKEEGSMIGAKAKIEVRHKESIKRERSGTIKDRERGKDRDPSTTFREPTIGKGLSGSLQFLQHSGTLKEGEDLVGRSMNKKKSNLIEIAYHNNGGGKEKEISLKRRDRFYRILTPEESFRMLCYAFHGKGPGERKVEKRMKQEQKLQQMKGAPLLFVEKMREAQARLQSPYLVLFGGHAESAEQSSGFIIEKGQPRRGLEPMLGDEIMVGACVGFKRKPKPSNLDLRKKPKTIFSLKKPRTC